MGSLHIIRRRDDPMAEAAIRSELDSAGGGGSVAVLLIQDAVLAKPALGATVCISRPDLDARGVPQGAVEAKTVDYDEICRMIVAHDRTVVW